MAWNVLNYSGHLLRPIVEQYWQGGDTLNWLHPVQENGVISDSPVLPGRYLKSTYRAASWPSMWLIYRIVCKLCTVTLKGGRREERGFLVEVS
ncbi:hypothetical protein CRG98_047176 [Punica granatum]|uniref:Uncharacterized protein n=1 Tax=Punica granatum TaxID=22663 RepID=A0A2I0HLH8_PUNGR|nr:hypothetical protein CRG98_047176 [Punica granatum]